MTRPRTPWVIDGIAVGRLRGSDGRFDVLDGIGPEGACTVLVGRSGAVDLGAANDAVVRVRDAAGAAGAWPASRVVRARCGAMSGLAFVCAPLARVELEPEPAGPAYMAALGVLAGLHARGIAHGGITTATVLGYGAHATVLAPTAAGLVVQRDTDSVDPWSPPSPDDDPLRRDVFALGVLGLAWFDGAIPEALRARRVRRSIARRTTSSPRLLPAGATAAGRLARAIDRACGPLDERPSSAIVLRALAGLSPEPAEALAPRIEVPVAPAPPPGRQRSRRARWALGGLAATAAAGLAAASWPRGPRIEPFIPRCASDADCGPALACAGGLCGADGLAFVAAGTFRAGSTPDDVHRANEPTVEVTLSRSFYIQTHEMTQAAFEALTGASPSWFDQCGPHCPVESINWYEALVAANLLSARDGLAPCYALEACTGSFGGGCPDVRRSGPRVHNCSGDYVCGDVTFAGLDCAGYRLPTEYEWEYAARGGSPDATYAGRISIEGEPREAQLARLSAISWTSFNAGVAYDSRWQCAWTDRPRTSEKYCGPHPVGSREPNAWGLHDMLGGVVEWTHDSWQDDPRVEPDGSCQTSRIGPAGNFECLRDAISDRVVDGLGAHAIRGGAWQHSIGLARAAARGRADDATRWLDVGLRFVRTARPPAPATD